MNGRLKNQLSGDNKGVEAIQFSDTTIQTRDLVQENLDTKATSADDDISGYDTDDTLNGGLGNDTLRGGKGSDTYLYAMGDGHDVIVEHSGSGTDKLTITGVVDPVTGVTVASTFGTDDHLQLVFDANNSLTIRNAASEDGAGVEEIYFENADVTWTRADLIDRYYADNLDATDNNVIGLSIDDVIDGDTGNDSLTGSGGDDTITGGTGNDTLVGSGGADQLNGGDGDDHLYGYSGNDIFDGGDGQDIAYFTGAMADYAVAETGGTTTVEDSAGIDGTDSLTNVELLQFSDMTLVWTNSGWLERVSLSSGADTYTASISSDYVDGFEGNDTLFGGNSNDTIHGSDGDDDLLGQNDDETIA